MLFFTYYMLDSGIKFFYDLGLVPSREPFQKLFNQGMILAEGKDGRPEKMSKSKGNVVNLMTLSYHMVRYITCLRNVYGTT